MLKSAKTITLLVLCLTVSGCSTPRKLSSVDNHFKKPTLISWPVYSFKALSRGFKNNHHGIDIVGEHGSPILAAHNGFVIYKGSGFSGYGKMVILDDGKGWATIYSHMSEILVKEKMFVSRGDMIGKMGNTGRSTGTHLHFELMYNKSLVDPKKYLP